MKKAGMMCRKQKSFLNIWMKVAVPVLAATIFALLMFLHVALIFLIVREEPIASEAAYEQARVLKDADLASYEEVSEKLRMMGRRMVAVLYDGQGNLLGQSLIEAEDTIDSGRIRISQDTYQQVLKRLKAIKFTDKRNMPGFETTDLMGNNYLYGREQFMADGKTYTLRFARIINPWKEFKTEFYGIGFLALASMTGLTLAIAGQYYGIYKERIKAVEYYRSTANGLAHDLKTPLMAISGYAEMLYAGVHSGKKEYYTKSILKNVVAMNSIIEDMMQLSRLENPHIVLNRDKIDLYTLTMETLENFQIQIQAGGIQTEVEGCVKVYADRELMRRTMENLVSNAVRYTPKNHEILISMGEGYWQIKNTGSRIAEEKLPHIWEPFVKGEEARGNVAGTGIGLTIVKEILELHAFKGEIANEEDGVAVRILFQSDFD